MSDIKLKIFEAFAGIGSQRIALRNIKVDYESVGICEVDRNAILAYDSIHNKQKDEMQYPDKESILLEFSDKNIGYNFSNGKSEIPKNIIDLQKLYKAHILSNNYGDIRKLKVELLPDFDFFTYSFPCKNISVAGNQEGFAEGSNTQSSLLWECKKIIEYKKPKYLMMENVKNIIGKNHIEYFKTWMKWLEDMGYTNYYKVFNAKNFNVPHNRERVIMISVLNCEEDIILPEGIMTNKKIKDILEEKVDDNYFIKKTKYKNISEILPNQDISYCIDAHYWKGTSVIGYKTKRRRQLVNDKNNGKIRRLTPLECWRLMGYEDTDFYKARDIGGLTATALYERAGRGIVVPMLEEIFKVVFYKYIE